LSAASMRTGLDIPHSKIKNSNRPQAQYANSIGRIKVCDYYNMAG
jgi:hypothetical protein